ncbi:MAG: spore maturation protein [Gammaproteobacteria bacterium]|nr:spore maturation protein [Gammaproteobacteria bacterium]MBU1656133.1 spore maturation protein [Gammaproteobacteria bacterium]MBU1960377.1 spore maturation protein [Gammaproteobacteria bacterium]
MNFVFAFLILTAFAVTAFRQLTWVATSAEAIAPMQALTTGLIESAASAVTLVLGLIGVMSFFLGLMKIVERGGLLVILAKLIRPLMVRLFPEVPPDHPAMGAMIMNFSANALGLGNAATPFGIRAMQALDRLNPVKGVASNSMALFLAINTSGLSVLPTGVVALRAAMGSVDPAAIMPTTLFATLCSTTVAVIAARFYQRFSPVIPLGEAVRPRPEAEVAADPEEQPAETGSYPFWASLLFLGAILALIPFTILYGRQMSPWIVPLLTALFLGFGLARRVPVYEAFIEGGKEGFQLAVRIIPYLVAILTAVGMFRASGALDYLISLIGPFTSHIGLPAEALPMALLRPLSGSGAYGIMAGIMETPGLGPDSYVGWLVSTMQGSTETTFYVLAVYFGAVQVKRARHAVAAALTADLAGIAAAVFICSWLYPT